MEVPCSARVGMEALAQRVGARRALRMRVMELRLQDAIRSACHPDMCLELVRMSVEFAEPICVTSYLPSPAGHAIPFSVCVDCGGCLCAYCYETTPRCEHGLCQPCAEKATYKCYGCNADVVACSRFCKGWSAVRRHYAKESLPPPRHEPSPHVLCPVCAYRETYDCVSCKDAVCPCCVDIHETTHVRKYRK